MQVLGGVALIALGVAAGPQVLQYLWLFSILSPFGILMTITALVLAIVGTVIAVRRLTRKREAVFALVFTPLVVLRMIVRTVASIAAHGDVLTRRPSLSIGPARGLEQDPRRRGSRGGFWFRGSDDGSDSTQQHGPLRLRGR